jgi:hypothetical protein
MRDAVITGIDVITFQLDLTPNSCNVGFVLTALAGYIADRPNGCMGPRSSLLRTVQVRL